MGALTWRFGCQFGGVPKRSNGADCKSAGIAFGGSNPPPTTCTTLTDNEKKKSRAAGVAQLARASAFQAEGRGFESRLPLAAKQVMERNDARSGSSGVERVLGKDEVAGSIPAQSSARKKTDNAQPKARGMSDG